VSIMIRSARAGDKPALVELTRTIWEGEDYLPCVFDEWLETPHGEFYVLEVDGRLAGVGRVSLTDAENAWLEGGRIHPEWQGQGLASILFAYQMHLVRRLGCKVARFTTASNNGPVQHLAGASGFEKITDSSLFEADLGGEFDAVVLGEADGPAAWEMIRASEWWKATDGLKCDNWEWEPITPARFDAWLSAGQVWGWPEQGRMAGVMVASVDRIWDEATCGLIAGSESAMFGLAGALRAWAAGRCAHVGAVVPQGLPVGRDAFAAAGYRLWDEAQQSLFKKVLKT
jgi:N-acetylglutamate synthase-like GNAT family acetyltransferase